MLFTRGHGLVPLIAKGAKRPSKEEYDVGTAGFAHGRTGGVCAGEGGGGIFGGNQSRAGGDRSWGRWLPGNCRTIGGRLRKSLAGLNAGMICAEVTTHLLQAHDPHEDLFMQFQAALDLLGENTQRARGLLAYVKAALVAAGYWPQFGECLACGRAVEAAGTVRFYPRAGGILCGNCPRENRGAATVMPGRLVLALERLALPVELLANPPARPADKVALLTALEILLAQVEAITDKPLRTRYLAKIVTDPRNTKHEDAKE